MAVARRLRRVDVHGESMLPTLEAGDRLVVVARRPRVGDVVAVRDPRERDRLLVKRVASRRGDAFVVSGDNPSASTDSRHFGPVDAELVVGVAVYRYFPAHRAGRLPRGPVRSARWTTPASTPSWPPTTSPD